jgi:hypothetical protein
VAVVALLLRLVTAVGFVWLVPASTRPKLMPLLVKLRSATKLIVFEVLALSESVESATLSVNVWLPTVRLVSAPVNVVPVLAERAVPVAGDGVKETGLLVVVQPPLMARFPVLVKV